MNHPVEQYTWNCMRGLMLHLDPERAGWCIDAGVGHFDFYCEWMHALGYPTLAVEPSISPEAVNLCRNTGLPMIEAALSDQDGIVTLFNAPDRDLRALDADVWGGMVPAQTVRSLTLQTLIDRYHMERITALKLDIEGAEPAVIATLPQLNSAHLPLALSFEWGGEWPAKTERGPWQPAQQKRVKDAFQLLRSLGYRRGLLIGSGDGILMRLIDDRSHEFYFEPDDNWGNCILTRGDVGIDVIVEYAQTTAGVA